MIFGLHAVGALLQKHPERITRLCVNQERQDKKMTQLLQQAKAHHITIELISRQELDRITQSAHHQGIVAYYRKSALHTEADLENLVINAVTPPFLLILDGIQDPHNLGACLRSADAAGVDAVIAPRDKSVGITPAVAKVASGAAETVPFIQVTNLARTLTFLKDQGVWIYGAAAEATEDLFHAKLTGSVALVLGAEGSGLRRLTKDHCDVLLRIPMSGSVASLNVSVATGIFLFEVVRQRQ
jgi:23S rRNA (guanosine2251-2'-O)-methyltransferase